MNRASSYFGFKCPDGHGSVNIAGIAGGSGDLRCGVCAKEMVPDLEANPVLGNVSCDCGVSISITNATNCPNCRTPF